MSTAQLPDPAREAVLRIAERIQQAAPAKLGQPVQICVRLTPAGGLLSVLDKRTGEILRRYEIKAREDGTAAVELTFTTKAATAAA